MKFPRYWSKATATETDHHGKPWPVTCWRWSDTSPADAQRLALEAARHAARRLARHQEPDCYLYGQQPLREEVIHAEVDSQGQQAIAITRNAYGVLVLNVARVMFIDIDFPPVTHFAQLKYFFARLFGSKRPPPQEQQVTRSLARLEAFLEDYADWGLRLYRTRAGLRLLVTHDVFDPLADSTQQQMEWIGADPLYVRLCRDQGCFRARLTPKPWRCGRAPNEISWPRESPEEQRRFDAWLAKYEQKQSDYATCRYLGAIGTQMVHPEVEPIIPLHDQHCGVNLHLPLA